MTNPRVIVLILSYNGKYLLEDSVSSYLANDYDNYEVAVVDNGSKDGTQEYVKASFPSVKIVRTDKNLGYSGGLNLGMKYAFDEQKADFVLITNNDVKADEHIISELVKVAITDTKIGFVTGKVYYFDEPAKLQTVGKKSHPILWNGGSIGYGEVDQGQFDYVTELDFCDDIFWLVSKPIYDKIGGYDENFFLQGEDYEWQARSKTNGFKIYYTPYAKLWHKESMSIGKKSPLKAYYDARNPMLVILMYQSPEFFKRFFWYFFTKIARSSMKNMIKLRFKFAIKQFSGLMSGLMWGLKNHKFTWRHFI